jgi:hypothetical protein
MPEYTGDITGLGTVRLFMVEIVKPMKNAKFEDLTVCPFYIQRHKKMYLLGYMILNLERL